MTLSEGSLRVEHLGASRHAWLYPLTTPRWEVPSLRVVYRKSLGMAAYAPGMETPYVRVRTIGGAWGDLHKAYRLTRPARLQLSPRADSEVEIWDGPAPRGNLLYARRLDHRDWDVFLVFLHSSGILAQKWFGRTHWVEAGWVSDYPPAARILSRAKPWDRE